MKFTSLQEHYDHECAAFATTLGALLPPALLTVLRPPSALSVTLLHQDPQPGKVYALNRFFYTLFRQFFASLQSQPPQPLSGGAPQGVHVWPNAALALSGIFTPTATHCDGTTGRFNAVWVLNGVTQMATVEMLIIRHGIATPNAPWIHRHKDGVRGGLRRFPLAASATS